MCLHNFLKNYTGIIFTTRTLSLPNQMKVSENKAKYSNLDVALEQVKASPHKIHKYLNTIQNGIEVIDHKKLKELKDLIIDGCKDMNLIPSQKIPVCDMNSISLCKLLGKCYIEGEKAQGVKEFPG